MTTVRDALENLVEPPIDGYDPANDDYDAGHGGPGAPLAMPDDCPVTPVGTEDGVFYFLTALGELRALTPDKVANKHIVAMFAPQARYLEDQWPRQKQVQATDPDGKPLEDEKGNKVMKTITTGWRNDDVAMLLMNVAADKGVWNAREKVRGRGAWLAEDGSLILHAGNHILIGGTWKKPGLHDGMVYPTMPAMPRPAHDAAYARVTAADLAPELVGWLRSREIAIADDASPATVLLELLKTWNWARPMIDPLLALGWIGAAMLGGALDYRPIAWLTGDKATGKSSLQKLIGMLFGTAGILQSPNASEAGVRQVLGQQSLPVAIDEAEAKADNRKLMQLVELARLAASSQGSILRGGQDHVGHEFSARTCFLFSSILVPPVTPADRSRMAMLELFDLPAGSRAPKMDTRELGAIGAWLRRRMAEQWQDWPKILETFTDALMDHGGQGGRAADQFGTLRAAAHALLEDELPDDRELVEIGQIFHVERFAETAGLENGASLCLSHLASSPVQLDRGGMPRVVASWVAQAAYTPSDLLGTGEAEDAAAKRKLANQALANIGLRILTAGKRDREAGDERRVPIPGRMYLAIACKHQGLDRLFNGSDWTENNWTQALKRIPGAIADETQRIGHRSMKCTMLPIEAMIDPDPEAIGVGMREMVDA